jgi:hypothetical protein
MCQIPTSQTTSICPISWDANDGLSIQVVEIAMSGAEDKPQKPKVPSPIAVKALAEAEARRTAAKAAESPKELGGRGGEDPARYGDWEVRGIATDF